MVTLREWWSRRWRGLAEWQRALLLTLSGGFVWSYGAPLLARLVGVLSPGSRVLVAGVLLNAALLRSTRRRLSRAESRLDARLRTVAGFQYEALLRLDVLLADMSDAVPDGGDRRRGPGPSRCASPSPEDGPSPPTAVQFAFVLVGNAVGVLVGLALGVGQVGSLPVLATSLLGGGLAVGAGKRWWSTVGGDATAGAAHRTPPSLDETARRRDTSPGSTAPGTGPDELESLGRWVRAVSDEFEVELEDDALRVRRKDRS